MQAIAVATGVLGSDPVASRRAVNVWGPFQSQSTPAVSSWQAPPSVPPPRTPPGSPSQEALSEKEAQELWEEELACEQWEASLRVTLPMARVSKGGKARDRGKPAFSGLD